MPRKNNPLWHNALLLDGAFLRETNHDIVVWHSAFTAFA
jgi:hypothetical protein